MSRPIQVMIVGAFKAGTTSLQHYLGEHPKIITHTLLYRELTFFVDDEEYQQGYDKAFLYYFGNRHDDSLILLAKHVGMMYSPEAIKRLKNHNPDIHIIAILRNPVDRAYSAYWHALRESWEDSTTFEEAISKETERLRKDAKRWLRCAYLDLGIYYKYLTTILEYFKKERVQIYLFEDFKNGPYSVCQNIFEALGIDPITPKIDVKYNRAFTLRSVTVARFINSFINSNNQVKLLLKRILPQNMTLYMGNKIRTLHKIINEKPFSPPPMNPNTRRHLIEYFRPYNEQLGKLLGRNLSHWNL